MNNKTVFLGIKRGELLKHILLIGILAFLIIPQLVSGGISGTAVITGNVFHSPVTQFTADITEGPIPLVVQFTDQSGSDPVSWNWDFGDGTNSPDQNPVHAYTAPGTYSVILNVTDQNGISSTVVKTNAITALPIPTPIPGGGDNGGSSESPIRAAIRPPVGYQRAPGMTSDGTPVNETGSLTITPYTPAATAVSCQMAPDLIPVAPAMTKGFSTGLLIVGIAGVVVGLSIIGFATAITPVMSDASIVYLGKAGNFVILAKTGITTTGSTKITGNIGICAIDETAIKGFGQTMDATNRFSISPLVEGRIYAADYSEPASITMTTTIRDMDTAYADASSRAPDMIELGAGNIGGHILVPGVYKWSTGVLIPTATNLTLDARDNEKSVWIFQIAEDLTMESGSQVVLINGAKAENIFWQVAGPTGVTIGPDAHVEGSLLTLKAISLGNGASLNGRALAQTAVTLIANTITKSTPKSTVVLRDQSQT